MSRKKINQIFMTAVLAAFLLVNTPAFAGKALDAFIDKSESLRDENNALSIGGTTGYGLGTTLKTLLVPFELTSAVSTDITKPTTDAIKESTENSNKARREALLAAADDAASFLETREITKPLQTAMNIVAEMNAQIHGIEAASAMTPNDLAIAIVVFASPSTTPQI